MRYIENTTGSVRNFAKCTCISTKINKKKTNSHYRSEISQNPAKSTNLDAKLRVGGKLFSSFSYNQNCCDVSILVLLL